MSKIFQLMTELWKKETKNTFFIVLEKTGATDQVVHAFSRV